MGDIENSEEKHGLQRILGRGGQIYCAGKDFSRRFKNSAYAD
jgi:hypothetical protein